MINKQKIIIVLGATAAGKSDLGLVLAQQLNGEIISADSMQVYRGMDIGTAKLPEAERQGIPHHLLDICDPREQFSVADFRERAGKAIADIAARGRVPLVVGGTGLYIDSLLRPYNFSEQAEKDQQLREHLKQRLSDEGQEALHRELAQIDPAAAARIHPNDSRRLIRALEVWYGSGQSITSLQQRQTEEPLYDALLIGLTMERELLYRRIEQRVDIMLEQGLVAEVEKLLEQGISRESTAMLGLGYRQIAAYICGEVDLPAATELLKRDTRRFAKRQLTWFRRNQAIHWFHIDEYAAPAELYQQVLELTGGFLRS